MSYPLPGERPVLISSRELEISQEMDKADEAIPIECDVSWHDNRSESYRHAYPDQGSLFVRRTPFQVRPPADTGVEYEFSGADQAYHLTLNDSAKRVEYETKSVRLDDVHYVCQVCRDVFNYYCKFVEARAKVSRPLESSGYARLNWKVSKTTRGGSTGT